jgi:hypothetical protein
MSFTDEEIAYLRSQRLARLAAHDRRVVVQRTVHQLPTAGT